MQTIRNSSLGPFLALGGAALLVALLTAALALLTAAPALGSPGGEEAPAGSTLTEARAFLAEPGVPPAPIPQDWCSEIRIGSGSHCELRSFTMGSAPAFAVQGMTNGSVQVEAWDGAGIRVTARVVARNARSAAAAAELAGQVELERSGGTLRVSGPRSGLFQRASWTVDLQVQVPQGTEVDAGTTNGNVQISGTRGTVRARSTNGNVTVSDAMGAVEARTTNGSLRVSLDRDEAGAGVRLELRTTNGSVDLSLPALASLGLEATTTNGRVTSDFPLEFEGNRQNRARGVLGGGEGQAILRTTNGAIRIHRIP